MEKGLTVWEAGNVVKLITQFETLFEVIDIFWKGEGFLMTAYITTKTKKKGKQVWQKSSK